MKALDWPESLKWAREFLPDYLSDTPCWFHAELMTDLEDRDKRLIARVAPRGHGKSVLAALAFPLWCICEQKRRNIIIVTHELGLATQWVRDIRTELESNEKILSAYGNLCDEPDTAENAVARKSKEKWTEEKFTTTSGITVHAKGVGASFRGVRVRCNRPDLIICDDIEKDALVESGEGRDKLESWLRRIAIPALSPGGRLLILGSMLHYDGLMARLADRDEWPRWDYRVYSAWEDVQPSANAELTEKRREEDMYEALWPVRWPVRRLLEERDRLGSRAFEQEYLGRPVDDSTRVFRKEWLRRWEDWELVPERLTTVMAIDPATGTEAGDFFAMWIGSIDRSDGKIYVRELTVERIGIVGQIERIKAAYQRWKPYKIGIETVAYQAALKQILDDWSRKEKLYLPIVELKPTGSKRARIDGASTFFENGTVRLPRVLDAEVEKQFLHYPKGAHDDAPDVCEMGIQLAREAWKAALPIIAMTSKGGRFGGEHYRDRRAEW